MTNIFYNREKDGTTYYFRGNHLVGSPTNNDGTCDFSEYEETRVSEYAEPLTEAEIEEIKLNLFRKEWKQFCRASADMSISWEGRYDSEFLIPNYPDYLPSFDEFVSDLSQTIDNN